MAFRMRLHIHVDEKHSLGPGKIALLEAIRREGSISAAARSLGMAYRHAWEMVDDLNQAFPPGVVSSGSGGRVGGGARLTPLGKEVVARFRAMERAARVAIAGDLSLLARARRSAPARRREAPAAKR